MSHAEVMYFVLICLAVSIAMHGLWVAQDCEKKSTSAVIGILSVLLVVSVVVNMDQQDQLRQTRELASGAVKGLDHKTQSCKVEREAVLEIASATVQAAIASSCNMHKKPAKGVL